MQNRIHDLRTVQRQRLFAEKLDEVVERLKERRSHAALHPRRDTAVKAHEDSSEQRREDQRQNRKDDRIVPNITDRFMKTHCILLLLIGLP